MALINQYNSSIRNVNYDNMFDIYDKNAQIKFEMKNLDIIYDV